MRINRALFISKIINERSFSAIVRFYGKMDISPEFNLCASALK